MLFFYFAEVLHVQVNEVSRKVGLRLLSLLFVVDLLFLSHLDYFVREAVFTGEDIPLIFLLQLFDDFQVVNLFVAQITKV